MVRAIRKISVARGYDPAEYVLVSFGGAGSQHACAMAESLGMRQVLIHPLASLLSAYGIGLADVKRFGERSVLRPYSPELIAELETLFAELEQTARAEVAAEGIAPERIAPAIRSLDLRYSGVESTIRVLRPENGDYAAKYEELHRQLYGYAHSGRSLEVTAARVEVVGQTADPAIHSQPREYRRPQADGHQPVWFGESFQETPIYFREQLRPGDEIAGPALISEPSSTIVVENGWTARLLDRGEVVLESGERRVASGERESSAVASSSALDSRLSIPADPVLLEIFNNLFASIAEQMGVTLQKTSCSTNVKERLDFSCAIFDPTGNLVVNAPHIPVHLGAMSETVKRIIADNPELAAGRGQRAVGSNATTVFVTNDPYRGGSHLPDVTVVTPVRDVASGELIFFTASRAHHAEIGGILPGSMPPFSRNLGEEGVLIRNFKLVDQGVSREEELRQILLGGQYPTRAVHDNLADIRAQVAANQSGVQLLSELVRKHTLTVVQAYMRHIQAAAATKMRQALALLPDGRYERTDYLDDGSPIQATITIAGDSAIVDFTGTGPVLKTNLNANRAIVTAAVMYVFRCLINEDIPLNGGVLEPISIVLPECLLNPPEHSDPAQSAAVVGGNVETSQRVVDVLLGALRLAACSQGTMNNLTFGDGTFGYYETICGGAGATPNAAGADAVHTHMTNTRLTDVEVIERRYPVRVHEFSIRRGSGGRGQHRGGDGITRRIEFLRPLHVSLLTERRGPYPPAGLDGGEPGAFGRNLLTRVGESTAQNLGGKAQVEVQAGDILTIETPGGGGFGRSTAAD
jgi:5-oxoprolinase (ATP-hydrolysing)